MYEEAILGWFLKPLFTGDCVKFKGQLKGFSVRVRLMRDGEGECSWLFICNHIFTGH